MVGQREAPLERAVGDPAVDVIRAALAALLALAAGDDQLALLAGDVDLVGPEPGDRQLDAIVVVAGLDQVERRVILAAFPKLEFSSMSNSRSKPTVERR